MPTMISISPMLIFMSDKCFRFLFADYVIYWLLVWLLNFLKILVMIGIIVSTINQVFFWNIKGYREGLFLVFTPNLTIFKLIVVCSIIYIV